MTLQFSQLDQPTTQKYLVGGSTTQLFRNTKFVQTAVSELEADDFNKYFQKGQSVSIRRVRLSGDAENFDPRGGSDASVEEPGYVLHTLTLENLWTKGYPTYSSDANVATYIRDFSESVGSSIGKSNDDYFYQVGFRDWAKLPSTGTVRLSNVPALQCVFVDSAGALSPFSDDHLLAARKVLNANDVPSGGRYAMISATAGMAFNKDVNLVSGFAGAMAPQVPGAAMINGVDPEMFIPRRGFMVSEANAVTGQSLVADMGDGAPTCAITSPTQDTTLFLDDDQMGSVPIGAVRITLTVTAALNPGIAVGRIARLGVDGGATKAYGVILRVDTTNKQVWLVPFNKDGNKLTASEIVAGTDKFGIPAIGSVNPAYHREHLVYASRQLRPPTNGAGAIAVTSRVPNLPELLMQIWIGSYNVNRFSETTRSSVLIGAMPSDHRKAVLMLSA